MLPSTRPAFFEAFVWLHGTRDSRNHSSKKLRSRHALFHRVWCYSSIAFTVVEVVLAQHRKQLGCVRPAQLASDGRPSLCRGAEQA